MAYAGRVLVVEDEVLIRMLAVDMLSELGYRSDEAGTAAEAIDLLRADEADFAFVFLDIGLPDRSGDELIRDVRASQPQKPLLVASGEDRQELKRRLGAFAPIAFLDKPYDLQRLRTALAELGL
ncbi:MAG TPA: response regulator [Pseudorhodoplanes sp.]|jgi:CheY-like chemotaxis protein|nr:response regulator [Pseudorhodoplanes sp.]